MSQSSRFRRILSQSSFPNLAKSRLSSVLAILLASLPCLAQEPSSAPSAQGSPAPAAAERIVIPAGTRIPLVLTHPIRSKSIHRGDDIYAQVIAPVTVGDQAVIPPGIFVQGKVDKLARKGDRGELYLQSISIVFPNGYVAPVSGPITLEGAEGYAVKDPGNRRVVSAFVLPAAGAALGALIGYAASGSQGTTITNTLPPNCGVPTPGCTNGTTQSLTIPPDHVRGIAIGSMVGLAAGGVAALVSLSRSHNFFLDVGSPVDITLPQPLSLDRSKVAGAGAPSNAPPVQVVAPPPSANPAIAACAPGQESCRGSCVDTITFMNDPNNCGRCGNSCSVGEVCTAGSCSCAPGYSSCMGSCVNDASFMGDNNNCGRCGNGCSIGQSCLGGSCTRTTPCAPGDLTCH